MQSVMFSFKPDVLPSKQKAILEEIESWDSIRKASHLDSDATNPTVLRMAYAYVENGSNAEEIVKKLSAIKEIDNASLPARRRLV